MASIPTMKPQWKLTIPEPMYDALREHLFPGDRDEHGAVILAGVARTKRGYRLLARELLLARDGVDYVPGERGYRMLRAAFIADAIIRARDQRLAYLAIHNHGGSVEVGFSGDDLSSHERGYPALLDIAQGLPVGGLVFARDAVAGDIWLPGGERVELESASVIGRRHRHLASSPRRLPSTAPHMYDRQTRLLGEAGNAILRDLTVGIVGLGGVGSLVVEYVARLGVGRIIAADPDRIDLTNLPRMSGASPWDARHLLTEDGRPEWLREWGRRLSTKKVTLARRVAKRANPKVIFEGVHGDVVDADVAARFLDVDYLFLAADSMQARLVANAIMHQYMIPGVQMGAKATPDPSTGELQQVFSVVRPINPASGCLWCSGLISTSKLQEEALTENERKAQRYVDDPDVIAPSVITLNAVAAAHAVNDFLFAVTGLVRPSSDLDYLRHDALTRNTHWDEPGRLATCPECGAGDGSRRARGDRVDLPTRLAPRGRRNESGLGWLGRLLVRT